MNNEVRPIDANEFECITLKNCSDEFAKGAMYILEKIDKAKTLDYEPVRYGHWVPKINNRKYRRRYYCSECGRCVEVISDEDVYIEYPYCNCCGCKMIKENDDD